MGFRARKTFKVAGVRMTVTPRGVGYSVGGRGYRVSRSATGRVSRTISLPGTGLSHNQTLLPAARRRGHVSAPSAVLAAVSPGLFAPKWEKALYKALVSHPDLTEVPAIATEHKGSAALAEVLQGVGAMNRDDRILARELLSRSFAAGFDPATHPFMQKYAALAEITIAVADGISAQLPLDRDAVGLVLAELHQAAGDLAAAVAVVEDLTPTTVTAVSLAELYTAQRRWELIVSLTDGIRNEDDASTFLLIQRGIALREEGHYDAAREALKEALRIRSRSAGLRHRALVERAAVHLAQGKAGLARKDLEKVYAEDSSYPGLTDTMAGLPPAR